MRIPKELIVSIILLVVALWDVQPRMEEYAAKRGELLLLKKQLSKELLFRQKQAEIEKDLEKAVQIHQENMNRFYPGNIPPETAMNQLQEMLKQTLKGCGLEMLNSKWGEPYKKEKRNFLMLPISFMALGEPPQIEEFLTRVLSNEKILNCPILNISKSSKDKLTLDLTITGYQLPSEVK